MVNGKAEAFFQGIKGKRVIVCGIGINNTPVVRQFLQAGAQVTACDRRPPEQLDGRAEELEKLGARLCLGDGYLDDLDADLVLRTPGMKPYLPQLEAARRRGVTVTSEMELFFELCPAPIYGVTGSDGKTTTTTILAGLLTAAGKTVHLGGNIGRALLPVIADIQPEDAAVVELSSFQLAGMEQSPHVAVVTNVAPNHLDWHTDMKEYVDAKRNLVRHQQNGDRAVLNADNPVTVEYAKGLKSEVRWFSRRHSVERGAWLGEDGILYLKTDGDARPIMRTEDIRLPGIHNIENFLAAITAADVTDSGVAAEYARSFNGVPHRCELVAAADGVRWYNDSIASSPSRTIAGLEAFDRPVIWIAGGYDKHIPYAPLGPVVARKVKYAILMGATADAIQTAVRACSDLPILRVSNMEDAVRAAKQQAAAGDIVFMSPASASFDLYKNFEQRGEHFRQLVHGMNVESK